MKTIIASSGRTDYRIVIADEAFTSGDDKNPASYAAKELAAYLGRVTGAIFPIVSDAQSPTDCEILLGRTNRGDFGVDYAALGKEGFTIKCDGGRLIIAGGVRGVLYGVYSFLEEYAGCRFYAIDREKVPTLDILEVCGCENTQIPTFEYRDALWNSNYQVREKASEFRVKQKFNSTFPYAKSGDMVGGSIDYGFSFCHSIGKLVPKEEYFEDHPEYFSMGADGIRNTYQRCLSNPGTIEAAKKTVRKYLSEHPGEQIFSITQDDNQLPCQCEKCRAIDEAEGSFAGTMIRFVNAIAEEFAEEYPDVIFDTFAYQYTLVPPTITKPRDNVCVRMCSINCCCSHPLEDSCGEHAIYSSRLPKYGDTERFKSFKDCVEGWSEICSRIYIWHYTTNFAHYHSPFPNFYALPRDIAFFARSNFKGVFMQGTYGVISGEFSELRSYLIAKLLWNPGMSEEEYYSHMDDFLQGYYGGGWRAIREYIDMLQEIVKDHDFSLYSAPERQVLPIKFVRNIDRTFVVAKETLDMVQRANDLFDIAEAEAGDEDARVNVRRSRIALRYYERFVRAARIDDLRRFIANISAHASADEILYNAQMLKDRIAAYAEEGERLYDDLVAFGINSMSEGTRIPPKDQIDFAGAPGVWRIEK